MKRTALRRVSKKQSLRNKIYRKAQEEWYSHYENQRCAICGRTDFLSIHHIRGRSKELLWDQTHFMTLCTFTDPKTVKLFQFEGANYSGFGCHGFIGENKTWAREHGYLEF